MRIVNDIGNESENETMKPWRYQRTPESRVTCTQKWKVVTYALYCTKAWGFNIDSSRGRL